MDKQLILAKVSKYIYRMTYTSGLVRAPFMKKFENIARWHKNRIMPKSDALFCIPKKGVIPIDENIRQEEMVLAPEIIDHFIEKSNYRAIMNYCICRDSNQCKDYPQAIGCLFLGEAAKGIHPRLARPATKEEAREHVRKAREAGLINLVGKASMDCKWLDIGPDHRLFTVCCCCPCCCISLATQYMAPDFTDWFHKLPGVSAAVSDDCAGCGACLKACIYNGIELQGKKAVITDQCRACGRCTEVCPKKAITVSIEDAAYAQQAIAFLEERVDVN